MSGSVRTTHASTSAAPRTSITVLQTGVPLSPPGLPCGRGSRRDARSSALHRGRRVRCTSLNLYRAHIARTQRVAPQPRVHAYAEPHLSTTRRACRTCVETATGARRPGCSAGASFYVTRRLTPRASCIVAPATSAGSARTKSVNPRAHLHEPPPRAPRRT